MFSPETYAILKKYVDDHGAGSISFDPEETYPEGSIGKALSQQSATIANLKSSDIQFAHDHMGLYRDADGDLCEL